jgi:hypothetical protein
MRISSLVFRIGCESEWISSLESGDCSFLHRYRLSCDDVSSILKLCDKEIFGKEEVDGEEVSEDV